MDNEIEIAASDSKRLVDKIKDWSYKNWQTILVVLIVLIVGVSAYNYNQQDNVRGNNSIAVIDENENNDNNTIAATEDSQEVIAENNDEQEAKINDDTEIETYDDDITEIIENNQTSNNIETEKSKETLSMDKNEKTYTITAKYGEGITHLARHALNEYIQENNTGANLKKEQKIYIEDYMQNRKGNDKIEIGHQETFSESLIKEAISEASNLSNTSIENLKQYIK